MVEQHPERTRLFMQWKAMDWPFMYDPFNLLNLRAVPITIGIDEHGIIRVIHPLLERADDFEERFVNATFDAPDPMPQSNVEATVQERLADEEVKLALWEDDTRLDDAIRIAEAALANTTTDRTHFNLGVIYRMRFDSPHRQEGDFKKAVEHWMAALNFDPNNYIWRRRLQQYGPRLAKPYPFYDWIPEARDAITERGDTPIELKVEPGGAEYAAPIQVFDSNRHTQSEPDPDNRIYQDDAPLIDVEMTVVPPQVNPGDAARVHVILRPHDIAHWNNEVDDTLLWVDVPEGWTSTANHLTVPNPQQAESQEARSFEFEVHVPEDTKAAEVALSTYALYYICEDVNGVCLYRRRDIEIPLVVQGPDGRRLGDGG